MATKRILYVSGSIGLGHVIRDLAIARQLHRQYPDVELLWLASHPATIPLKEAGEKLLPEAHKYADVNFSAENAARGFGMNVLAYGRKVRRQFSRNVIILKQVIGKDLLALCARAYPIIKQEIPDLHMVLVCGPRHSIEPVEVPDGIEIKGYVPSLYEHFAAGDLVIVLLASFFSRCLSCRERRGIARRRRLSAG